MNQVVIFESEYDHAALYKKAPQRSVGIVKGTKMDPNYLVVDILLPIAIPNVVIYRSHLTFLPLTASDLTDIASIDQFQQTYPEYFI